MSHHPILTARSRRDFLRLSGCGFGSMALAALCAANTLPRESPLAPKQPHFAPAQSESSSMDAGWSIPHGPVRLQAASGEGRR